MASSDSGDNSDSTASDNNDPAIGMGDLNINGANEEDLEQLLTVLQWIGIDDDFDREKVSDELAETLDDLKDMKPKEMEEATLALAKTKQVASRVIMSAKIRKRLVSVVHWVQDFYRCSEKPTLNDVTSPQQFLELLEVASERDGIRTHRMKNSSTLAEQTDPGALKGGHMWPAWLEAQENHLSCTYGVKGTPLSYLIRKVAVGDPEAVYSSFDEKTVACAPLSGPSFEADAAVLHQKMISWTQGQDSHQFIKKKKKENNGRVDYLLLANHYGGAGNNEVRLKKAQQIKDTLHYKNEKVMKFNTFLAKVEEMCNIFDDVGQSMWPDAKLTFLLDRVQNSEMSADISTLRAQKVQGKCDYTFAADFLGGRAAATASGTSYGRSISGMTTNSNGDPPAQGIYTGDGSLFTGKYPSRSWYALSGDEKQKVNDTRRGQDPSQGPPNKKYGTAKNYGGRKIKAVNSKKKNKKEEKNIAALARDIAAMKRTVSAMATKAGGDERSEQVDDQAGTAFGGKNEKKRAKTNSD